MGLNVYVFKHPLGDCTNGGISSKATQLCVVNVDGPFEPRADIPAVMLTTNQMGDPVFKPAFCAMHKDGQPWEVAQGWFMMGGNYATTTDSRLVEAVRSMVGYSIYGALPIHDRQE